MKSEDQMHRIVTDAKYCAGGPFFWTEVVFRSKAEITTLIAALNWLLKSKSPSAHFHVSDLRLAKDGLASSADIVFFGPLASKIGERARDRENDVKCAGRLLRSAKLGKK